MDVVSSVGAVVGLVFNLAKAIKTCHDIKGRYEGADEAIGSVRDELETLQGALKQLMELMVSDAAALSSRWDVDRNLPRTFAGAMRGFERTIMVLMRDLEGMHSQVRDGGKEMAKGKKVAFLWNESGLNAHCVQLRSQAGALHFLLGVLNTGSMSEVKTDLGELKAAIEKLSLSSRLPDEPLPAYAPQLAPSAHLLDFQDDLMDIEKTYPPAQMDSPPAIHSAHGEILFRALTPNTTGESLKSRSRGKKRAEEDVGLGVRSASAEVFYMPDRLDEFRSLPKKPLASKSPHNTTGESSKSRSWGKRPEEGVARAVRSKSPLIPTGESSKMVKRLEESVGLGVRSSSLELLYMPDRLDEFGSLPKKPLASRTPPGRLRSQVTNEPVDNSDIIPSAALKPKTKSQPRSSLEKQVTTPNSSPDPSDKSKPVRQKISRPAPNNITKTPEILAIEQRLTRLRQTASSREVIPEIIRTVMTGDIKAVTVLLNHGHDIEARHPINGSTSLILAASLGYFEMLELLMDRGADIGAEDYSERSALHYAASESHPECTELLLAYGALPEKEDLEKETPLHRAARYLRSDTVEVLLKRSTNPLKYRNSRDQTALHLVARNRGLDIITSICESTKMVEHVSECSEEGSCHCPILYQGTNKEDSSGDTALQSALFRRSMDAVSLLLKYTPGGANTPHRLQYWSSSQLTSGEPTPWERPLHFAARAASKTLVKRLLDGGADMTLVNSSGQTPLEVAIANKNTLAIRTLISHEAGTLAGALPVGIVADLSDAEFEDVFVNHSELDFGASEAPMRGLLRHAIASQQWEKFRCLVSKAVSKAAIGKVLDDECALQAAIENCSSESRADITRLILEKGASVKVRLRPGSFWNMPLHLAAEKNDVPLAEVLISHGASLMEENGQYLLPFHHAVIHGNEETISYFSAATVSAVAGSSSATNQSMEDVSMNAFVTAIIIDSLPRLISLLQDGPLATSTPPDALLNVAVAFGRRDITAYLLEKGCDVLLLEKGCDPQHTDEMEFSQHVVSDSVQAASSPEEYEACRHLIKEAIQKRRLEIEMQFRPLLSLSERKVVDGTPAGVKVEVAAVSISSA